MTHKPTGKTYNLGALTIEEVDVEPCYRAHQIAKGQTPTCNCSACERAAEMEQYAGTWGANCAKAMEFAREHVMGSWQTNVHIAQEHARKAWRSAIDSQRVRMGLVL